MAVDFYELFRKKSKIRSATGMMKYSLDDRIANAISGTEVKHVRLDRDIPVSFVYDNKALETEVFMETYASDLVEIGDYIEKDNMFYIVYRPIKAVATDQYIKKFKLLECNVNVELNGEFVQAYYLGAGRKTLTEDEIINDVAATMFNGSSLLILPTSDISISQQFMIKNRQWKVVDFDNITLDKIMFITLENVLNTITEKVEPPVINPKPEDIDITTTTVELMAGYEYSFKTEDGYFAATKDLNILQRTSNIVKVKVAYSAAPSALIKVKKDGVIVEQTLQIRQG